MPSVVPGGGFVIAQRVRLTLQNAAAVTEESPKRPVYPRGVIRAPPLLFHRAAELAGEAGPFYANNY